MQEAILIVGLILGLISIVSLFSNLLLALFLFTMSLILIILYYQTPHGKAEIAKAEENKRVAIELGKSLENRFKQLSDNPSDLESLEYILKTLATLNKASLKTWMRPVIIPLLKLKSLDKSVRDVAFSYAQKTTSRISSANDVSSKEFYEAVLDILSEHPDQISLKQYVLEVGRWHSAMSRPDGKITIYDEQAIQNDISVRSK